MYSKTRVSCEDCIYVKQSRGLKPDCKNCESGRVVLNPENNIISYLTNKYGAILVDGMGGISASGIRLVLELEKDIIKDKADIVLRVGVYLKAALNSQSMETNNEKNDQA